MLCAFIPQQQTTQHVSGTGLRSGENGTRGFPALAGVTVTEGKQPSDRGPGRAARRREHAHRPSTRWNTGVFPGWMSVARIRNAHSPRTRVLLCSKPKKNHLRMDVLG